MKRYNATPPKPKSINRKNATQRRIFFTTATSRLCGKISLTVLRPLPAVLYLLLFCLLLPLAAVAQETAEVKGYRSALFGMSEKEVRRAIQKDFNVSKKETKKITNQVEKTTSLIITVNDILPDTGPVQIIYILGYKSKKLIQANLVWGKPANPEPDNEALISTANLLRNYFVRLGFPNDKMVVNAQLNDNSILVFRGTDEKKRMVTLLLNNSQQNRTSDSKNEISLQLSYIEKPDSPDIFLIPKGLF